MFDFKQKTSQKAHNRFINGRQQAILDILKDHDFASVTGLSSYFEVSEMTIRRDLCFLEDQNTVRRVHGGAVLAADKEQEPVFDERAASLVEEKRIIADMAAKMVGDNSVVALDTGSTALSLVQRLTARDNLTVITTNIHIMTACLRHPNLKVIVPGGVLRSYEGSLTGTNTVEFLSSCHVDQFFMGVGGIDAEAGVTEYSLEDIAVKRALAANAGQVIVLADSSKFGKVTCGFICPLDAVDMIISNKAPGGEYIKIFNRLNVPVKYPA
ncbi:MAG: DeoR/GlpR family DNA-binding transcription regulator [Treponema sp.]|jgi:DeoR/GlpR family transcriptional regulator of sugar metabolism|nr:DeoR/GlpR family DNA-binding transcription regulator [Treponema sp.]